MILPVIAGYIIRAGVVYAVKKGAQYATKRAAQQALKKQAQQAAKQSKGLKKAKPKKACAACKKSVKCFNKPKGMSDKEFDRQLKEQQDAINNTTADQLAARRDAIKKAGGTGPLRDLGAQNAARTRYKRNEISRLRRGGMSPGAAAKKVDADMGSLAATHRLDIIAGGDPSDISGLGDKRVNSSLGSQWKGARSQELEDIAKQMKKEGLGKDKMDVELKRCK
jgi:hypothetical protein